MSVGGVRAQGAMGGRGWWGGGTPEPVSPGGPGDDLQLILTALGE